MDCTTILNQLIAWEVSREVNADPLCSARQTRYGKKTRLAASVQNSQPLLMKFKPITISEANHRSDPLPGPELSHMVDNAKVYGEVPNIYATSVVRRVNGRWMAPQMCKSCRSSGKVGCDGNSPCALCVNSHITCETDGCMQILAPAQITANIHSNNASDISGAALLAIQSHIANDRSTANPGPQAPPRCRSRKRKATDDDFTRETDVVSADGIEVMATKSSKRTTRTRKLPTVKYHQSVQEGKPEPYGKPPVWADKRQQLCETLPYYRAYQSGAYRSGGIIHAFMCDKEVGPRDKFDDEIMIARVGGGRTADENGVMVPSQNQNEKKGGFASTFSSTSDARLPVAVIAGQGNRLSPSKLPHYYNVLDWFHITDVWYEKLNGFNVSMARLEKINLTEKSWWAPRDSAPLKLDRDLQQPKTTRNRCGICHGIFKSIYNAGWACLDPNCAAFFKFPEGYNDETLDYNEEFMKERTQYLGPDPGPLAPPPLTDEDIVRTGSFGIEKECCRGIVCPKCKCCSRRIEWAQWSCENPTCDFTYRVKQIPMRIEDVIANSMLKEHREFARGGIRGYQGFMGQYAEGLYVIPGLQGEGDVGWVRVLRANGIINQQPDGPNDLFIQMQEKDLSMKRNPVRNKGLTAEVLTKHWATNFGAAYKYGVSVLSKGFDEAPPVILKAVRRLTWAGQQTVAKHLEPFSPFNELLAIGYFETAEIGYHDDGEKELGPTVATLSLGGDATMMFRPKAKKPTELPAVLCITLRHGDIVVMHGTRIQKLYEHKVIPHGQLRFALTCRYIRPEMMENDEERQAALVKGALPKECEQYVYDGDINATEITPPEKSVDEVTEIFINIYSKVRVGNIRQPHITQLIGMLASLTESVSIPTDGIEHTEDEVTDTTHTSDDPSSATCGQVSAMTDAV